MDNNSQQSSAIWENYMKAMVKPETNTLGFTRTFVQLWLTTHNWQKMKKSIPDMSLPLNL